MRVTAGRVLEEVVADIYLMGAKPVGEYEAERVEACIKDLQLDRAVALDVIKDVTKQRCGCTGGPAGRVGSVLRMPAIPFVTPPCKVCGAVADVATCSRASSSLGMSQHGPAVFWPGRRAHIKMTHVCCCCCCIVFGSCQVQGVRAAGAEGARQAQRSASAEEAGAGARLRHGLRRCCVCMRQHTACMEQVCTYVLLMLPVLPPVLRHCKSIALGF